MSANFKTNESSALIVTPTQNLPLNSQFVPGALETVPHVEAVHIGDSTDPLSAQNEIAADKQKLRELLDANEKGSWEIGDLICELFKRKVTLGELSADLGRSVPTLSQYKLTCEAFPKETRDQNLFFYEHTKVAIASQTIKREVACRLANETNENVKNELLAVDLTAQTLMADVLAQQTKLADEAADKKAKKLAAKPSNKKAKAPKQSKPKLKIDQRKTTLLLGERVMAAIEKALGSPNPIHTDPHLDRCYNMPGEALLKDWKEKGVDLKFKIIHMDPPFGQYSKHGDGHLDLNTTPNHQSGADNISEKDALKTTIAHIRMVPHFLDKGGVALLWQAGKNLRWQIDRAIMKADLEHVIMLFWPKPNAKLQWPNDPYGQQFEVCYVLKRRGDTVMTHNGSKDRSNILDFWFDGKAMVINGSHEWAKPQNMMEHFIERSSFKGESVLDLFGCTGPFSKAAIKLGRHFVYCESHPDNYAKNAPKIERALEDSQKAGTNSESGDDSDNPVKV